MASAQPVPFAMDGPAFMPFLPYCQHLQQPPQERWGGAVHVWHAPTPTAPCAAPTRWGALMQNTH